MCVYVWGGGNRLAVHVVMLCVVYTKVSGVVYTKVQLWRSNLIVTRVCGWRG